MSNKTITTTVLKANLFSLAISIPLLVLYVVPFLMLHSIEKLAEGIDYMLIWFILVFPVGIIFHELLHGVTWALFAEKGWSSIRFGVQWKVLTPYCHCTKPLFKWQYLLGTIMPFVIMGVNPVIYSLFSGNAFVLIFGLFFSWAAGGDLLGVWMLRSVKWHQCVADHPYQLGFSIVDCAQK